MQHYLGFNRRWAAAILQAKKPAHLGLLDDLSDESVHLVQPVLQLLGSSHIHHIGVMFLQQRRDLEHGGVRL